MDNKSKIPKPSVQPIIKSSAERSKREVKPDQSTETATRFLPYRLKRRSKSVTDLSTLIPPKLARLNQNTIKEERMPTTSRGTVKQAPKCDEENKSKGVKQPKIPNWDYKSRFQILNEKYTHLLDNHNTLKAKHAEIEELSEIHNVLKKKYEQMEIDYLKLSTTNNDLICDNNALKKSNSDIINELNSLSTEIKTLTTKYNDLEAKENQEAKEIERLTVIEKSYCKLKMDYDIVTNKIASISNENTQLKMLNEKLDKSLTTKVAEYENLSENLTKCKQDLINGELLRRKLHNNIQDLKGNIRVFCRVRPPINEEENNKLQCLLTFPDENTLDIRKSKESISAVTGKPLDYKAEFLFDRVFQPESTQAEFFEELSQLVQSALDGYDVCVFAYGQTGSGKTYTMQGVKTPEHLGMVPRSVDSIFKTIENLRRSNWIYTVKVSFLEIYNECVRDLLDPDMNRSSLEIKYNEGRGITVTNLKIENINSPEEFDTLFEIAQQNRMVAATDFNDHSSRSHAIYKIYLYGSNEEYNCSCAGSVNLVDLAGSERAKPTSLGERLTETKNINTSLSTLGHVMLALYNKEKHVPYRNSKLTYLLQSSLGGNSKTLMVVNISPFEEFYQESITSLRFATKVKEVKVLVKKNKAILTQPTTSHLK